METETTDSYWSKRLLPGSLPPRLCVLVCGLSISVLVCVSWTGGDWPRELSCVPGCGAVSMPQSEVCMPLFNLPNWCRFTYSRFAYSHFAYLLPLGAISPTDAKCDQNNVKQLKLQSLLHLGVIALIWSAQYNFILFGSHCSLALSAFGTYPKKMQPSLPLLLIRYLCPS